ncbi:MAG: hypothetical protein ACLT98_13340 [Eggerthellaceae bacterium]
MRACGAGSRAGSREIVHHAEGGYQAGETDGALQVTEQRTFDFDGGLRDGGPSTGFRRTLPSRSTACVWRTSMPMARWWAIGRRCRARPACNWRESGGPGKDSYSFDAPSSVYVFFNASATVAS